MGLCRWWSLRAPSGTVGLLRSAASLEQMPRMTPDRVKLTANYLLRFRQLQLQRDVLLEPVHVLVLRVEELVLVLELERRAADVLGLLWREAALESVARTGTNGRSKTCSRAAAQGSDEALVLRMLMHGWLTAIAGRHHRAHLLLPMERTVRVPLQQVPARATRNLIQHVAQLDLPQVAADVRGNALNRHGRVDQHVLLAEEVRTHHLAQVVRLLLLGQWDAVDLLQREGDVHDLVAALPARRQVDLVDDLVAVRDKVPLRQLADLVVRDDARL